MALSLSKREQRALPLIGLLGALILWVYLAYVIGPLQRYRRALAQEVRTVREHLKLLEGATVNDAALKDQYAQVQQRVETLRGALPTEEAVPAIIALLTDLAAQAQLKIQTIFPQRPMLESPKGSATTQVASEPIVYKEILIQIDALAGYHQLGTFLSLVESSDKPMQVASLRISTSPKDAAKRHQVKLILRSYFATAGVETDESPRAQPS